MQKAASNATGKPRKTPAKIVETHLQKAWRGIDGAMTLEEFAAAAWEAATAIAARDRLTARIAAGEVVPGKIIIRCAA